MNTNVTAINAADEYYQGQEPIMHRWLKKTTNAGRFQSVNICDTDSTIFDIHGFRIFCLEHSNDVLDTNAKLFLWFSDPFLESVGHIQTMLWHTGDSKAIYQYTSIPLILLQQRQTFDATLHQPVVRFIRSQANDLCAKSNRKLHDFRGIVLHLCLIM